MRTLSQTQKEFVVGPEKRASKLHWFYGQLFVAASPVTRTDTDLRGKTTIVTGSSGGLGLEIARQLLDLGAKHAATLGGSALRPRKHIRVWPLGLASKDSILDFIARIRELDTLDMGAGRIVLVSSDQAAWATFKDRHSKPILPAFKKIKKLARQVPSSAVTIVCANSGLTHGTKLARQARSWQWLGFAVFFHVLGRPCSVAARTIVHAATLPGEQAHGQYVEDEKPQALPPMMYGPEGLRFSPGPCPQSLFSQ
ncbi:NAD(P)-binding protein [Xylaria longipes]|nr:NAD(P)-binding protein [Xylaria longipes]